MQRGMSMQSENIIDFMNNNTTTSTFDFNKNWDNNFINIDEDDDIIINTKKDDDVIEASKPNDFITEKEDDDIIISPKKDNDDVEFDNSFEEDNNIFDSKILNIINDIPEEKVDSKQELLNQPTELDSFFDSIYNGVEDANELLSQINLKKQTLQETEKEIVTLKEQIAREKEEFAKYMDSQKQALELEKQQLKEKGELQRLRLSEETEQVKNDTEVRKTEIELREQKLKVEQ